jgi:outer membrane protein insertion porin family
MNQWIRWCCVTLALTISAAAYGGVAQAPATVSRIDFVGNRRVSSEIVRALIFTRPGDPYCEKCLQSDLQALRRNPDYFENVRLEVQDDRSNANAKIVIFHLIERFIIRRIEYRGLKSVTQSDVVNRFKDRKVDLSMERSFDPTEIDKAEVVIRELLAEHGWHAATVKATYENIPGTNAVHIVFTIDEGPSGSN